MEAKMKPLTHEHLDLAENVKNWIEDSPHAREEDRLLGRDAIAFFLHDQFKAEDQDFDTAAWLIACGDV
jgi:dsDNA-binding SOS-regulon protein